jgi:predicted O-methyltransferase YrrM
VSFQYAEVSQIELLPAITEFRSEYDELFYDNDWFSTVDFEVYYGLVRHFQPERIIEIGSGHSTIAALAAVHANGWGWVTAIDPEPRLDHEPDPRLSRVRHKVENVPLADFDELGPGDILFIDSSHIDVEYEYDMILPRIRPGVVAHIHDVFLPDPYPPAWLDRFFNEDKHVEALLETGMWEVLWSAHVMHREHPGFLAKAFRSYRGLMVWNGIGPSSLWLRRR